MDYTTVVDWIRLHWVEILFLSFLLLYIIRRYFIKKRGRKEVKEEVKKEEVKEEPKVQEEINLDTIGKFIDINWVENNNLEHLKSLKEDTLEEINTLKEQYKKAEGEFKSLLVLEKRLKIHIQTLMHQESMYENQINALEGIKKNGGKN